MTFGGFDPEIVQDFLTESGELLDRLEGDLVNLEAAPSDPELLNQVFRALHTIKGSASFLALTNLVEVAHAAESALNAARNSRVRVDRAMMDLLLEAVDILKRHFDELRHGAALTKAPDRLVAALAALGEGQAPTPPAEPAPVAPTSPTPGPSSAAKLNLPPGRSDLLEFLVEDLRETTARIEATAVLARTSPEENAPALAEVGDALTRSAEFFGVDLLARVASLLASAGDSGMRLRGPALEQALVRIEALAHILRDLTDGLAETIVRAWDLGELPARLTMLLEGEPPEEVWVAGSDVGSVMEIDHVRSGLAPSAGASTIPAGAASGSSVTATAPAAVTEGSQDGASPAAPAAPKGEDTKAAAGDQTLRVEVGRLDALMNLVGELVLQKNRVAALSRRAGQQVDQELGEAMALAASSLDRVASDIQAAVMRTRMQPLDKVFGRYPRLIRDLCRKTGKKIDLVIEGGETEVDRSVIEELGDPLVHLLRNAADHGLEGPEERAAAGKPETGEIRLSAWQAGSHVMVRVADNGRGLSRDRIARKAVERGLATEAEIALLPDREVYKYIFEAGFSTAEQVTDLSGRGVGMDVVRTNIQRIKGTIELDSVPGQGCSVVIKIPLTVAIMPAMLVGVCKEVYAIPLSSVVEIVRPSEGTVQTIRERAVMRLRDTVLPLVDSSEVLGVPSDHREPTPFAVVLGAEGSRFGLLVSSLVGQQEIVVKSLDWMSERKGPISGATVRDDGGVSLIIDVAGLVKIAQENRDAA